MLTSDNRFGIRILHKRMKGLKQGVKDENALSLLDPFVKLLSDLFCPRSTRTYCLLLLDALLYWSNCLYHLFKYMLRK